MLLTYCRHRFPSEIIQHAIWLYLRFTLSYRDLEELLAERGVEISYETVMRSSHQTLRWRGNGCCRDVCWNLLARSPVG
jgi:transposase-like protein